jgi:hypothetical protein
MKASCIYQTVGGAPVITGETLASQCGYYGIKQEGSPTLSDTIYSVSFWPSMAALLRTAFFLSFFF